VGIMQRFTDREVLLWLGVTTVAFALLARWGYFAFERQARRLGRLDQTTLF